MAAPPITATGLDTIPEDNVAAFSDPALEQILRRGSDGSLTLQDGIPLMSIQQHTGLEGGDSDDDEEGSVDSQHKVLEVAPRQFRSSKVHIELGKGAEPGKYPQLDTDLLKRMTAKAPRPGLSSNPLTCTSCGELKTKRVAIITSGGDAPGMNAALRSCVAVCLSEGARVFGVRQGYKGLYEGGQRILEVNWGSIEDVAQTGGTVIGSARFPEFKNWEVQLTAANNLAQLQINNLICLGGDGSLTGATRFKSNWPGLIKELVETGRLTQEKADQVPNLNIVGMVGSIDNDLCGFSTTIGADTALRRIVDACDYLITTAESHSRSFVVEVMGRNCGYLALAAAIAVGADWVFVPERPPDMEDWETAMLDSMAKRRETRNFNIVIVAEGATDRIRRAIKANYLREIIEKRLKYSTRVTTLGHVQRGGSPSAADRVQACRVGAEAAYEVLSAKPTAYSCILGMRWNQVVKIDLAKAIAKTQEVGVALESRNFDEAMVLRGTAFCDLLKIYWEGLSKPQASLSESANTVLVMCAGSPAAGMNAAIQTVVRKLLGHGCRTLVGRDGFFGAAQGLISEIEWDHVDTWEGSGGCKIGTNRVTPARILKGEGLKMMAEQFEEFKIDALIVIGGFEGYKGLSELCEARDDYPCFCIPMCCIPASISNNVPGTEVTIGCDTSLNCIVDCIDHLKLSAESSRGRLFVVETQGGYCGYLAVMGALAGGADMAYIHEEIVNVELMQHDVEYLRRKFAAGFNKAVLVRNEACSKLYDIRFMQQLFEQEGSRDLSRYFSVRNNVLGHLQQGNRPSPFDRVTAARLGAAGCDFIFDVLSSAEQKDGRVFTNDPSSAVVVGIQGSEETFNPLYELAETVDFERRRPLEQWWLKLNPLVRILALNNGYDPEAHTYTPQSVDVAMDL
eukprot:m.137576 g.137576  ORF g.137576 m.137576 type:complete len:908 (-) comp14753_c0_seq1:201-2924(-)